MGSGIAIQLAMDPSVYEDAFIRLHRCAYSRNKTGESESEDGTIARRNMSSALDRRICGVRSE